MDFKDYLIAIGILVAITLCVATAVIVPSYYGTKYACEERAEQMGLEHSYGFLKGCFVRDAGRWIPMEQLRSMR